MKRGLLCTLLLLAVIWLPMGATTFTVSNTNNSGTGSLRQAISDANGASGATAGSPHIINATGISGTISLQSVLPAINNHLTINGPGASSLTITRGVATGFRILYVNFGYTVTIDGVTITNGLSNEGGGMYSNGTLTVSNATFSGNNATRLGGGIFQNGGTLTVTNFTISGNSAVYGGGGIWDVVSDFRG